MARTLIYAFRITHIDNIRQIEKNGLVRSCSPLADPEYKSIGDNSVIGRRADNFVNGLRLSEYIPFYLGPRSPMLYVIQNGYNDVSRIPPEQIVYCVIRLNDIMNSTKDCVFTDGHALNRFTKFYPKSQLPHISELIKYEDVFASSWISDSDLDLKRRKEAELLVKDDLEPQFIRGYLVYNDTAKQRLISLGINEGRIIVKSNYYF